MRAEDLNHLVTVLQGAQTRHKDAQDPVEVLASFGGFEMAMMVGVMLVAGSKRNLVIADGMTACAALMVASRIAPPVTDYCVYCRSHNHHGLDRALSLFQATVSRLCPPEVAELFMDRALRISHSFRLAIAFHNSEDSLALKPILAEELA